MKQDELRLVKTPYAAMLALLNRQTFELVSFSPVSIACCQTSIILQIKYIN